VERGPEVLCLESVDLHAASGGRLDDVGNVRLDPAVAPREEDGPVVVRLRRSVPPDHAWPYGGPPSVEDGGADDSAFDVPLVPYHDWAERGPSTMRMWLPVESGAQRTERIR
jgi:hypothetical protein